MQCTGRGKALPRRGRAVRTSPDHPALPGSLTHRNDCKATRLLVIGDRPDKVRVLLPSPRKQEKPWSPRRKPRLSLFRRSSQLCELRQAERRCSAPIVAQRPPSRRTASGGCNRWAQVVRRLVRYTHRSLALGHTASSSRRGPRCDDGNATFVNCGSPDRRARTSTSGAVLASATSRLGSQLRRQRSLRWAHRIVECRVQ